MSKKRSVGTSYTLTLLIPSTGFRSFGWISAYWISPDRSWVRITFWSGRILKTTRWMLGAPLK